MAYKLQGNLHRTKVQNKKKKNSKTGISIQIHTFGYLPQKRNV